MKIYTKTGDQGVTCLYTGERVEKDCLRVEAYGTIDELDSVLGLARSSCWNRTVRQTVFTLQKLLTVVMAEVAGGEDAEPRITDRDVQMVEQTIDRLDARLPALDHFVIPGDTRRRGGPRLSPYGDPAGRARVVAAGQGAEGRRTFAGLV